MGRLLREQPYVVVQRSKMERRVQVQPEIVARLLQVVRELLARMYLVPPTPAPVYALERH